MAPPGRIVACPACSTGYILPEELIGSGGARVRCPQCGRTFVVEPNEARDAAGSHVPAEDAREQAMEGPEVRTHDAAVPDGAAEALVPGSRDTEAGRESREIPAGARSIAPDAAPEQSADDAERLANDTLDALAGRLGESVAHAASEGRLFAEHGPEIMASFDAWRRAAGRDADPAVFRAALKARWGVDLE